MVSVHVLPSEKSETAPCPSLPRGGRMWPYLACECSAGVLWSVLVHVFLFLYPAPPLSLLTFLCPQNSVFHKMEDIFRHCACFGCGCLFV